MDSNQTGPDEGKSKKSLEDRDDLIFDLIKRRYDGVLQNVNALETKAATLIGFVAIVVGLIVAGGAFEISKISKSFTLYIPYFASVTLLLGSIYFGLRAFKEKRNYLIVPNINVILKYAKPDISYSHVLQSTGWSMIDAINQNVIINEQKTNDIDKSWNLLLVGLVSVLILLVSFTFGEYFLQFAEMVGAI